MNNPYSLNPLPDAAKWLEDRIGRPMNARALVDAVIKLGRMGDPAPTIIKALLPRRLPMAVIAMPGHRDRDALEGGFNHKLLSAEFGDLPMGLAYVGNAREDVAPLCVNQLLDFLTRGDCEIACFETSRLGPNETIWLMPFGKAAHHATLETCVINERDLLALGDLLAQAAPQVPDQPEQAPPPEPVQAAPVDDRLDVSLLAEPDELIEAFGRFTGMNKGWFSNITDKPGLAKARRVTGQKGKGGHAPLFCPLAVMQWLTASKRKVGSPISEEKAWLLLESHFPMVYAAHSSTDPREG